MSADEPVSSGEAAVSTRRFPAFEAPFLRAPEGARSVFLVTLLAACAPLGAGVVFFGWRALVVAAICVMSCTAIERVYYRLTRTPALLGRTHAYLTGVLLALTLPAFVPWYVPLVASIFAIIVGKAVFGGVGHFLWQPALVGRLAVAVMFPALLNPGAGPLLAQDRIVVGDIRRSAVVEDYEGWRRHGSPPDADAFRLNPPGRALEKLTRPAAWTGRGPAYSGLMLARQDIPNARPAALRAPAPNHLPPINDLLYGARPGGIGETCIILLLVAGLYLFYRNYVKWQLPVAFLASAWGVAAVAPVFLAGPNNTTEAVWWPLLAEGLDVGLTYVNYQILTGGTVLAATFLATEMTSRPVTTGGQVVFALGCGAGAMLLKLYTGVPIPAYMAVLAMNTLTPVIDAVWRPRVFGRRRLAFLRRRLAA
jgi:electron transport complex protein RnfD